MDKSIVINLIKDLIYIYFYKEDKEPFIFEGMNIRIPSYSSSIEAGQNPSIKIIEIDVPYLLFRYKDLKDRDDGLHSKNIQLNEELNITRNIKFINVLVYILEQNLNLLIPYSPNKIELEIPFIEDLNPIKALEEKTLEDSEEKTLEDSNLFSYIKASEDRTDVNYSISTDKALNYSQIKVMKRPFKYTIYISYR